MANTQSSSSDTGPRVGLVTEYFGAMARHLTLMLFIVFTALVCAVLYLHLASSIYTITFKVTPVANNQSQAPARLSSLASLAGVSLRQNDSSMAFDLYLEELKGSPVADALAAKPGFLQQMFPGQWDEASMSWKRPSELSAAVRNAFKSLMGIPINPWQPPGAAQVQSYLQENIFISKTPYTPVVTITMNSGNKEWGEKLLWEVHQTVDNSLRQKSLSRTNQYVKYLKDELSRVTVSDYREALISTLADQEKNLMMASALGAAYSAEPLEPPRASASPNRSSPAVALLVAVILGLGIGALASRFLDRRELSLKGIFQALGRQTTGRFNRSHAQRSDT